MSSVRVDNLLYENGICMCIDEAYASIIEEKNNAKFIITPYDDDTFIVYCNSLVFHHHGSTLWTIPIIHAIDDDGISYLTVSP